VPGLRSLNGAGEVSRLSLSSSGAGPSAPGEPAATILLLDDDTTTLLVLHAVLERTQARIIECEAEPCALRWCQELSSKIDLLVSDVVLEYSNGPAVVRKARPLQPLMKLLYISGYSLPELQRRGLLFTDEMVPGDVEFLQKPFSLEQFLGTVSRLLIH